MNHSGNENLYFTSITTILPTLTSNNETTNTSLDSIFRNPTRKNSALTLTIILYSCALRLCCNLCTTCLHIPLVV